MSARLLTLLTRTLYSLGFLSREFRGRFYAGLAAVFTVYTVVHFSPQILSGYSADRLDYDGGTLDLALEWRLSSPAASDDIVIVDIDERSLALLAEDYGRWPWPRSVMGDFLALLSEREPAAIGVNVMYSDADLNDPDGDALLGEIIGYLPNVTFPMTRLSPENDSLSEVVVGQIPGAVVADGQDPQGTLSLLYTLFSEAHANMGLNNLVLDDDGVVRRQQPQWLDDGFTLPSMAYQMARLGGAIAPDASPLHPEYLLNWRNKQSDYTRLSFVDVYNALLEGQEASTANLAGKFIIVGLTAPGLAVLKGTALGPATDDNLPRRNPFPKSDKLRAKPQSDEPPSVLALSVPPSPTSHATDHDQTPSQSRKSLHPITMNAPSHPFSDDPSKRTATSASPRLNWRILNCRSLNAKSPRQRFTRKNYMRIA